MTLTRAHIGLASILGAALATALSGTLSDLRPTVNSNSGATAAATTGASSIVIASTDSHHTNADYIVPLGTDMAIVLRAAITQLTQTSGEVSGGSIKILAGTYTFLTTCTANQATDNNILIEGESCGGMNSPYSGPGSTGTVTGTIFRGSGANPIINVVGVAGTPANRRHSIEFRSIKFEQEPDDSAALAGLQFANASDIAIDKCVFKNCSPAISNTGGWDFQTTSCAFENCGANTSLGLSAVVALRSTTNECASWRLVDCTWQRMPGIAFYSDDTTISTPANQDIEFVNCKFHGGDGIHDCPAIVGAFTNLLVQGCFFFKSMTAGPATSSSSIIISKPQPPIYSTTCRILGNWFFNFGTCAIDVDAWDTQVANNSFNQYSTTSGATSFLTIRPTAGRTLITSNTYNSGPSISIGKVGDMGGSTSTTVIHDTQAQGGFSVSSGWTGPTGSPNIDTPNTLIHVAAGQTLKLNVATTTGSPTPSSQWLPVTINGTTYMLQLFQ